MRKFAFLSLIAPLSFVAPLMGQATKQSVLAPSKTTTATRPMAKTSEKKTVFFSRAEAEAAYQSGDYGFYDPRYLGLFTNRQPDGKTTKVFALERDTIAEMLTFGNRYAWVILPEGTEARFDLFPDGTPFSAPYALHKCGNPIKSIFYPRVKVATPVAPAPQVIEAPAPQVVVHVPAPQVTIVPAPPTIIQAPAPQVTVQQQAPAPVFGPKPSVLPTTRFYDMKPNFDERRQPMIPEAKKGLHWGWKLLGGAILGFAVYKALDHKKAPEAQRSVVTDPPTGAANGGFAIHF